MIVYTGAHRALPDVLAMEAVMTHPLLASSLTKIPVRSAKKQLELWSSQKQAHLRCDTLIRALGKPSITVSQAKKLDQLGLSYKGLVTLWANSGNPNRFSEALKEKGVNSKPLRLKLASIVHC